jgi:DNA polymerase II small subunit/DNA polymerase delta subunit B
MVVRKNNRKKKEDKQENKKVKNATKIVKYGIHFKSKLEVMKTIVEDIENADYLEQNKVKFSHYGDGYDFSML